MKNIVDVSSTIDIQKLATEVERELSDLQTSLDILESKPTDISKLDCLKFLLEDYHEEQNALGR